MGGGVVHYDRATGKYTNVFAPGRIYDSEQEALGPGGQGTPLNVSTANQAPNGIPLPDSTPAVPPAPQGGQGPVLQDGTKIPGAEDMDLTKRGAAENFFNDNKSGFTDAGRTDKFADALLGQYGNGTNIPHTSNRAEQAYQDFRSGPSSAGLDPYYQNAKRSAGEDIDKRLSARGMYGSSAADDQIREAMTNLSADQANRTADFDLRRAQLGGSLASGADASSAASGANDRAWLTGLGGLAQGSDTLDLNKLNSGMSAASTAQTQQGNRTENAFNNTLNFGDRLSQIMGGANTAAVAADQTGTENAANLRLGQGADAANAAVARANADNASWDKAFGASAGTVKAETGLMDSLNKPPAEPAKPQPAPYSATAAYQYPPPGSYNGSSAEPWNKL